MFPTSCYAPQASDGDPRLAAQMDDGFTEYKVTTHTSDVQDASTDADVFLVLYSATGMQYSQCSCTLPCVTAQTC